MPETITKPVSAILSIYEKELVMYPYFKLIFSIPEKDIHIRIKQKGQGHGLIYEELVMNYMELNLTKRDAMMKAREVIMDYYNACNDLTKK